MEGGGSEFWTRGIGREAVGLEKNRTEMAGRMQITGYGIKKKEGKGKLTNGNFFPSSLPRPLRMES
jgi:hypothetical protein